MAELPLLYRVARRMAGDPLTAQDIVAESLMKAALAWESFDGRHRRAWLVRIVRNEYLMHLRSLGSRPETALLEDFCEDLDVADQVFRRITDEQLLSAVDQLPPHYREVVVLCDVEGMAHVEAATILDVKPGTIASRLNRARTLLRNKVGHLVEEGLA